MSDLSFGEAVERMVRQIKESTVRIRDNDQETLSDIAGLARDLGFEKVVAYRDSVVVTGNSSDIDRLTDKVKRDFPNTRTDLERFDD